MRDIKVQPHANRIGGHKIIHLARLEHRHLRIAGARRQSAHDHRSAAAHPA